MVRHIAEARPALNPYDAKLEAAQMKLIRRFANFHPTRVIGHRLDRADCENAAIDIMEFAEMCDDYLRAYGEYIAAHSTSISAKDITDCFASPFRDALDGNATHILREAASDYAVTDGARDDYYRDFVRAAE